MIKTVFCFQGDNGLLDFSIDTTGVTPSYSYGYFFVNPTTGALSVITRLSEDSNTQRYLVRQTRVFL